MKNLTTILFAIQLLVGCSISDDSIFKRSDNSVKAPSPKLAQKVESAVSVTKPYELPMYSKLSSKDCEAVFSIPQGFQLFWGSKPQITAVYRILSMMQGECYETCAAANFCDRQKAVDSYIRSLSYGYPAAEMPLARIGVSPDKARLDFEASNFNAFLDWSMRSKDEILKSLRQRSDKEKRATSALLQKFPTMLKKYNDDIVIEFNKYADAEIANMDRNIQLFSELSRIEKERKVEEQREEELYQLREQNRNLDCINKALRGGRHDPLCY